MKQGDIWQVYLQPSHGSEQSGNRPAVIISGDLLNKYLQVVIVCPLTSKIKNYKGNVILQPNDINNLNTASEVLSFHLRSISKKRLTNYVGKISENELEQIKSCLGDILRY